MALIETAVCDFFVFSVNEVPDVPIQIETSAISSRSSSSQILPNIVSLDYPSLNAQIPHLPAFFEV